MEKAAAGSKRKRIVLTLRKNLKSLKALEKDCLNG